MAVYQYRPSPPQGLVHEGIHRLEVLPRVAARHETGVVAGRQPLEQRGLDPVLIRSVGHVVRRLELVRIVAEVDGHHPHAIPVGHDGALVRADVHDDGHRGRDGTQRVGGFDVVEVGGPQARNDLNAGAAVIAGGTTAGGDGADRRE